MAYNWASQHGSGSTADNTTIVPPYYDLQDGPYEYGGLEMPGLQNIPEEEEYNTSPFGTPAETGMGELIKQEPNTAKPTKPPRKRPNRYANASPAVIERRRHQNRDSQRAYRKRKDDEIVKLRAEVEKLQRERKFLISGHTETTRQLGLAMAKLKFYEEPEWGTRATGGQLSSPATNSPWNSLDESKFQLSHNLQGFEQRIQEMPATPMDAQDTCFTTQQDVYQYYGDTGPAFPLHNAYGEYPNNL